MNCFAEETGFWPQTKRVLINFSFFAVKEHWFHSFLLLHVHFPPALEQAHRSKSLTQIDCLDPKKSEPEVEKCNSQRDSQPAAGVCSLPVPIARSLDAGDAGQQGSGSAWHGLSMGHPDSLTIPEAHGPGRWVESMFLIFVFYSTNLWLQTFFFFFSLLSEFTLHRMSSADHADEHVSKKHSKHHQSFVSIRRWRQWPSDSLFDYRSAFSFWKQIQYFLLIAPIGVSVCRCGCKRRMICSLSIAFQKSPFPNPHCTRPPRPPHHTPYWSTEWWIGQRKPTKSRVCRRVCRFRSLSEAHTSLVSPSMWWPGLTR